MTQRVLIVGAGFAGLAAARALGGRKDVAVTVLDRTNHHLFQPLLYQVAMAGLSPAEIASPIRSLLARYPNVEVLLGDVTAVDLAKRTLASTCGERSYDYLILACGATHSYFGHDEWAPHAPGLKTLAQATEIRRRVLVAFENAEREMDRAKRRACLTFAVVGGGPTGVELAGALAEISRHTLKREFRNMDPATSRIVLIEAGSRLLASFSPALSGRAQRDLEQMGVAVWLEKMVTHVDAAGVTLGDERLEAGTVLWAAGVQPSPLNRTLAAPLDRQGRIMVQPDLSLKDRPEVFVLGDQAHVETERGPLPGLAPVAMQQGRHVAINIMGELAGRPRRPFVYLDKGQMATIGRRRAVAEWKGRAFAGGIAWLMWLVVHIYYLIGFKNRLFVLFQWAWSYVTYRRGARLIVER